MSITITTDVVCDGCSAWVEGLTGVRSQVRASRAQAKLRGWYRRGGKDLCPSCAGDTWCYLCRVWWTDDRPCPHADGAA